MPDLIGHLPRSITPSLPSVPAFDGSFLMVIPFCRISFSERNLRTMLYALSKPFSSNDPEFIEKQPF